MKTQRVLLALSVLLIAALACNFQSPQATSTPDLAGTITAQAATLSAVPATPSPSNKASPPEVSVTSMTNCRTGPGNQYDLVFTMNPGMTAQVIGKNTPDNYWIIDNPVGGTCWLWGQYAQVSGDTSSLPEYPAPPSPTPKATKTPKPTAASTATLTNTPGGGFTLIPPIIILRPPAAPTNFAGSRDSCTTGIGSDGFTPIYIEGVTLTWTDNATNETGYYIYKGGARVSTIPANSTVFKITLRYPQSTGNPLYINFGVAAYNSVGTSAESTYDVFTCP